MNKFHLKLERHCLVHSSSCMCKCDIRKRMRPNVIFYISVTVNKSHNNTETNHDSHQLTVTSVTLEPDFIDLH